MRRVLAVYHRATTNPGAVGRWLREQGYQLDVRVPAIGDPLPEHLEAHEGVIVFGGGMSANDDQRLPFIRTELDWIEGVLAAEKPFFGICLGAQLLSRVLGGTVGPHPEAKVEIGYYPTTPTEPGQAYFLDRAHFYHWNSEGFTLPSGAVKLASSQIFENQAFRYGDQAYGVQFHPEIDDEVLAEWGGMIDEEVAETMRAPGARPWPEHLRDHALHGNAVARWLDGFLSMWLGQAPAEHQPDPSTP